MLHHQLAALIAHAHAARQQFLPHARPAFLALDLAVDRLDVRELCVSRLAALLGSLLTFRCQGTSQGVGAGR